MVADFLIGPGDANHGTASQNRQKLGGTDKQPAQHRPPVLNQRAEYTTKHAPSHGVEPVGHPSGCLRKGKFWPRRGNGHANAEQGAAKDVAVICSEKPQRRGTSWLQLHVAKAIGERVDDPTWKMSIHCKVPWGPEWYSTDLQVTYPVNTVAEQKLCSRCQSCSLICKATTEDWARPAAVKAAPKPSPLKHASI
ncbi:hypothetical protein S40293_11230 [Stachybotrys chartarum IBT 40293]|nr:hypothetical protein S40293_11230 [Stachybotrys chartarum IBT 40293]